MVQDFRWCFLGVDSSCVCEEEFPRINFFRVFKLDGYRRFICSFFLRSTLVRRRSNPMPSSPIMWPSRVDNVACGYCMFFPLPSWTLFNNNPSDNGFSTTLARTFSSRSLLGEWLLRPAKRSNSFDHSPGNLCWWFRENPFFAC